MAAEPPLRNRLAALHLHSPRPAIAMYGRGRGDLVEQLDAALRAF